MLAKLAGDLPGILLCDTAAAFPSVSRRLLRIVLRPKCVPDAVVRVIDAINSGMILLLNTGGFVTIGLVKSGIAEGVPQAGVFWCAPPTLSAARCMRLSRTAGRGWSDGVLTTQLSCFGVRACLQVLPRRSRQRAVCRGTAEAGQA